MPRIVQVTDPHLGPDGNFCLAGVATRDSFQDVLAMAADLSPDLLLVTGDIAAEPNIGAYENFFAMLQDFRAPVRWLPGNHDDVSLIESAVGAIPFDRTYDLDNWRILMLNSLQIGSPNGHLSEAELNRFESLLSENTQEHLIVALHHHPLALGSLWLDKQQVDTSERLLSIVEGNKRIRAVLWGHVHQVHESTRNDVLFASAPSTCVQFKPNSDTFALDDLQPGLRVIDIENTGELNTQVLRLPAGSFSPNLSTQGY